MSQKKPGKPGRKAKPSHAVIKKRYLLGEKPASIAKDYEGLTAAQVTDLAKIHGWKAEKDAIINSVADAVAKDLRELTQITIDVHTRFMKKLMAQMDMIENPYLLDGERTNSLFQTAMNNAVKLAMAQMQVDENAKIAENADAIAFIGLPSVDFNAL